MHELYMDKSSSKKKDSIYIVYDLIKRINEVQMA